MQHIPAAPLSKHCRLGDLSLPLGPLQSHILHCSIFPPFCLNSRMAKESGSMAKTTGKAERLQPASAESAEAESSYQISDPQALGRNMARVAAQSQHLISEFLKRQSERLGNESFDPVNVSSAYFSLRS